MQPQNYKKMIETLLLSLIIIAIAMLFLLVKVIFKRGGRFSSQHVHDNPALRRMGVHCVMDQDREDRQHQSVMNDRLRKEPSANKTE